MKIEIEKIQNGHLIYYWFGSSTKGEPYYVSNEKEMREYIQDKFKYFFKSTGD